MKPFLKLFEDLQYRGLVKQFTDPALPELVNGAPMTLYCGFDPTADSLHIGHLLPLMTLRRFQLAGHRPIAVVGGATGMIGDPSGKSQERNLLIKEVLEKNVAGIRAVISRFLDLDSSHVGCAKVVNNADWFEGHSYISFLRDVGKHFTINHMMTKESVRARLEDREHGISYTEFSYMLLQAYDFYWLNKQENCTLQIGGSDQWGNITAGIELTRRMRAAEEGYSPENAAEKDPTYGITLPLVLKSDGTKFGKTEGGAIWLDADKTSPYRLYQFLIQTPDADVMTLIKYFTFLSHERINELDTSMKTQPEKREAQNTLARELTRLTHGDDELARAERASAALFGAGIRELDEKTLLDVFSEAPSTSRGKNSLASAGVALVDLLAETGLLTSKGAARKEILAGGIYLNNERVTDVAKTVTTADLLPGATLLLRKGKRTYHLVRFH
ncbi:tyrosine--tRNA ligase [Bdellovibrionota bacterium FG-2]